MAREMPTAWQGRRTGKTVFTNSHSLLFFVFISRAAAVDEEEQQQQATHAGEITGATIIMRR